MPIPIAPVVDAVSENPAPWAAAAAALLVVWTLAVGGLLAMLRSIARRIAARRRTPVDKRTITIAQVEASSDYHAATPAERAALGGLDPGAELVHEAEFARHSAAVARDTVGEDRCGKWPYRHINLEEAAEDLRSSRASIRIGESTYYYRRTEPDDAKPDLHGLYP